MANWNELFLKQTHIEMPPESEVLRFAALVHSRFKDEIPQVWDLCCGGGRHTVTLARQGFKVFASDNAVNGINHLSKWLESEQLNAAYVVADMSENPWPTEKFHGVICWNSINHNCIAEIRKTIQMVHNALVPGGLFLVTLKSTKADRYGQGKEIEHNTFVPAEGNEAGVIHHYFDLPEIRTLFSEWQFLVLCEEVIKNYENLDKFWQFTPFRHTTWGALLQKR